MRISRRSVLSIIDQTSTVVYEIKKGTYLESCQTSTMETFFGLFLHRIHQRYLAGSYTSEIG